MAVPYFDTRQFFLYMFFLILPFLVGRLIHLLEPSNDQELSLLFKLLTRDLAVPHFPLNQRTCTRKRDKKRNLKPVSAWKTGENANRPKAKTYLWALARAAFRVGCYVEFVVRILFKQWRSLPRFPKHQAIRLAFKANWGGCSPFVCFDSNSIPVGVDNHASRCLANDARLFENLHSFCSGRVGGIEGGLEIQGQGTLVLDVNDDDSGRPHCIKIPNSLHLPDLKMCLLLPQHWAQEVGDNYPLPNGTSMKNTANNCTLIWGQGAFRKTIPFDALTNTPIFYTSPKTSAYRAFAATFMALEAPFYRREPVLQLPGLRNLVGSGNPLPEEEFVAEENINYSPPSACEEG
jgi:hypothetical protein